MSKPIMEQPGSKVLLMGNEAIARGAIEAGVQLMAAYPGTPSSEICEALIDVASDNDYYVEWSTNEKVAFEVAAGASLVGARSMVAMKNAGLNVAMDTFMTIPYGGVKGGMVVVVADDPDAHYSSTEQDTRTAAIYAEIPCLEPMDQQEAKDMTKAAFEISERLELPVFLRSVSRISHASGDVKLETVNENRNKLGFNKHYKLPYRWNVYGAPGAVHKHEWLHRLLPKARDISNNSQFNELNLVGGSKVGILTTGLATSYAKEALKRMGLSGKVSHLKLGMIFPLADRLVSELLKNVSTLIVIEEGDPVVENLVRSLSIEVAPKVKIYGKGHNQIFKPYGEINTDIVTDAIVPFFDMEKEEDPKADLRKQIRKLVTPRSSTFCAGCSHLGSYYALRLALRKHEGVHIVNGDIGCYEQGGYGLFSTNVNVNDDDSKKYPIRSPYETLDTIYVMGSGIGMAQGQAQVGYKKGKVVAVAGDSTFIHATLPAVVNAVYSKADITFIVLDNSWTCMTGHQPNPCTGVDSLGKETKALDIQKAVMSLGVEFVKEASAYNTDEAMTALSEALEFEGPSVVVLKGECQLQVQRRTKKGKTQTWVDQGLCTGCKSCVQLGCPAITFDSEKKRAGIDEISCTDCTLCMQVCPVEAIKMGGRS
ncbi:MAG: thiamine pyrophosphate-dependent enzyme [Tepidanaerobacteraceae bacterium]|jgi:indolepyruvate ferredoxin oxidoreductase alpha subunit